MKYGTRFYDSRLEWFAVGRTYVEFVVGVGDDGGNFGEHGCGRADCLTGDGYVVILHKNTQKKFVYEVDRLSDPTFKTPFFSVTFAIFLRLEHFLVHSYRFLSARSDYQIAKIGSIKKAV